MRRRRARDGPLAPAVGRPWLRYRDPPRPEARRLGASHPQHPRLQPSRDAGSSAKHPPQALDVPERPVAYERGAAGPIRREGSGTHGPVNRSKRCSPSAPGRAPNPRLPAAIRQNRAVASAGRHITSSIARPTSIARPPRRERWRERSRAASAHASSPDDERRGSRAAARRRGAGEPLTRSTRAQSRSDVGACPPRCVSSPGRRHESQKPRTSPTSKPGFFASSAASARAEVMTRFSVARGARKRRSGARASPGKRRRARGRVTAGARHHAPPHSVRRRLIESSGRVRAQAAAKGV